MATLIRIHKNGGPEVLQFDEVANRPLQPGEIRLKVEAIGLNRAEIMYREGKYLETGGVSFTDRLRSGRSYQRSRP